MMQWEGELVCWGAVQAGLRHDSKGEAYHLLSSSNTAYALPRAAPGRFIMSFWRLPCRTSQRSWSLVCSARNSSIRWQTRVAQLSAYVVWKAGVPTGSPEWTAHLAGWEWRPRGIARLASSLNACMVGAREPCRNVSSAKASGRARPIAATSSKGPCSVRGNRSSPRRLPCHTPHFELTTVLGVWWTMRWLCLP
jgi:hypothetical protein